MTDETLRSKLTRTITKKRKRNRNQNRTLRCQKLDERKLMAADITLSGGVLEIEGDHHDDQIVVSTREIQYPIIATGQIITETVLSVTVDDETNTPVQSPWFRLNEVDSVVVNSGPGNDNVQIDADLPAQIDGGSGSDQLTGGPADDLIRGGGGDDILMGGDGFDTLLGEGGNDTVHGGNHGDVLQGGRGNDTLRGDNGHDELRGGSGNDQLFGGRHNDELFGGVGNDGLFGQNGADRLFGGLGSDTLNGGAHNDALIGGEGLDALSSGPGFDRFLSTGDVDAFLDRSADDVEISFLDSTSNEDVTLGSRIGDVTAMASSWNNTEIGQVDDAFKLLLGATGNNALLAQADGSELVFRRYGDIFEPNGDEQTTVGGWNGGGEIVIINNAIDQDWLSQVVIHEIGHNFDEPDENAFVQDFRDAASWQFFGPQPLPVTPAGLQQATDGSNWYFDASRTSEFARGYGQTNPLEDFATAFAAKIMTDVEMDYQGEDAESVRGRMGARFDVLEAFFASLA